MSEVSRRGFIGAAAVGTVAAGTVSAPAWAVDSSEEFGHGHGHGHAPRLRNLMATEHPWATFLAQQDLVWRQVPTRWYDGPFLGNGRLGTMVYQELGQNSIRFEV